MRAAARGLLDFEDGCSPDRRGLLREMFILNEIVREDQARLSEVMAGMKAANSQVVTRVRGDAVAWEVYDHANDQALLAYQRLGKSLCPWDSAWQKAIERTQERVYDKIHEIGDTGLSDEGIVRMISDYEEAKADWERRSEPSGSESA